MKKSSLIIAIALLQFINITTFAQETDNGLNADAKQVEDCVLWKIQGLYSKPSYVFAKINGLCQEDMTMTDGMQIAFYDADELVLEVDYSTPELKAQFDKSNKLPKGKSLQSYFKNEADYKTFVANVTKKMGDGASSLLTLKPLELSKKLSMADLTCETKVSFDDEFIKMALDQKKVITGLESINENAKIFDKISNEDYSAMLMKATNGKKETQITTSLYKAWNIKELLAQKMELQAYKNNANDLLYFRNKKWANDLKSKINNKSCFIVVDAANVTGENGLLMTLLLAGFSFEPVMQ